MIDLLYDLYGFSFYWHEDEEDTIERLREDKPTSTLLKLEFLSSLSLDLSMTTTRYSVNIILNQQEESFRGIDYQVAVERFIKFISKPRSLLR
jgi:hypothetical protein